MAQNAPYDFSQSEARFTKFAEITRAAVLVMQDTNTLSFAAAVDPMRAANRQAGRRLFEWHFVTPDARDVMLTSGLRVPAAPVQQVGDCDVLLVVAGFDLDAQATPALLASLRRLSRSARVVAGIDGGPWIMARAGLLDGHRATIHWEDLDRFAMEFPAISVENARFVDSGARLTSGGAAPAIEMMLHLIARWHGAALSDRIAGILIYDAAATAARPQNRQNLRARHSPATARAHAVMEASLDDPLPITVIARRLGLGLRALQMQFRARLETTPQAHYLTLRLSEADRLVCETAIPLLDVALATGFSSQASFARAYRGRFGTSARTRRAQAQ